MKILVVAPHPFFTPRGTPVDVDIPGVRIVRIPRLRGLEIVA